MVFRGDSKLSKIPLRTPVACPRSPVCVSIRFDAKIKVVAAGQAHGEADRRDQAIVDCSQDEVRYDPGQGEGQDGERAQGGDYRWLTLPDY